MIIRTSLYRAVGALTLIATLSGGTAAHARQAQIVDGVDCSQVQALGIDRQTNLRASSIMVGCGLRAGGVSDAQATGPDQPDLGGTDKDVITGSEVSPHVTQSESMIWAHGTTFVINYNDSRTAPSNYSGVSYSTNSGTSWTRLNPSPFASGHGTNYGDPIVVYNNKLAKWFAGDLASGCGGQGIGLWTSTNGIAWVVGACARSGTSLDRESMWVDNNASSPHYGRMYISYNDFAVGGGALYVVYSDNGTTWTRVQLKSTFIRDVQLTGSPSGTDGTVYVATMNEGGGLGNPRRNYMYRSTNGGASWTNVAMGASFTPPGGNSCHDGYFYNIAPIWRHMGWGQPAATASGVVGYDYAGGRSGDQGDIYFVRSTNFGVSWSAPIKLNTDTTTKEQWMPSLAATNGRRFLATWYDRRATTNGTNYEYWGRVSTDAGVTWGTPSRISDVLITQPTQPDPNVQSCYAGDYMYMTTTTIGRSFYGLAAWTDGRKVVGSNQQDVEYDGVLLP